MSDGDLVRQVLAGRTEAYEELVRRWARRIAALCHAKVGSADGVDDLTQETLLRGFHALPTLAEPDKFGPWLCGIAQRVCLDWLKARGRAQASFSSLGPDFDPEDHALLGADDADWQEDCRQLLAEIEALPEALRQVVMLYYYQDVTYQDLAQLLGVSPGTINVRLTKARLLLRERLAKSQPRGR